MGDLEGLGIELKDRDASKGVAVGIEELIVVNIGMLADDPFAIGAQIGLGWFAFNAVAEFVLPLVGVRQIELVGEEEDAGDQGRGDEDRNDDPIKADAGGLDGDDFVGALQQTKSDEHGQEHAHGRNRIVEEIGRDVEQVLSHGENRDAVVEDVTEQLEQRKDQQEHDEGAANHGEIEQKIAQHVIVKNGWETEIE